MTILNTAFCKESSQTYVNVVTVGNYVSNKKNTNYYHGQWPRLCYGEIPNHFWNFPQMRSKLMYVGCFVVNFIRGLD